MGLMNFEKVAKAEWFTWSALPDRHARLRPHLILTMSLVMVVVMIESTGMFLALGDMAKRDITQDELTRGLRTDGWAR
jgi:NCS2 family nucleobase:cation symporter-2